MLRLFHTKPPSKTDLEFSYLIDLTSYNCDKNENCQKLMYYGNSICPRFNTLISNNLLTQINNYLLTCPDQYIFCNLESEYRKVNAEKVILAINNRNLISNWIYKKYKSKKYFKILSKLNLNLNDDNIYNIIQYLF